MKHIKLFEDYSVNEENEQVTPCTYYKDKKEDSEYEDYWKKFNSMSPDDKKREIGIMKDALSDTIDEIKEEYTKWFKDPETIKKFTAKENPVRGKLVSEYIPSIKMKLHLKPSKDSSAVINDAWGYFSPKSPTEINLNLYKFFNGKHSGNKSIKDTMKHEMAHAIDNYFSTNGVRAYDATHPPTTSEDEYMQIYLINDKDQFARLNILRGIIKAGPADTGDKLLDKFMEQVKNGTITSEIFQFSKGTNKKGHAMLVMDSIQNSKSMTKGVDQGRLDRTSGAYARMVGKNAIMVDGKESYNLEQLFSNFGAVDDKNRIIINMEHIAKLNYTSASIENNIDQNIA